MEFTIFTTEPTKLSFILIIDYGYYHKVGIKEKDSSQNFR